MMYSSLVLALALATSGAHARIAPADVRPSTICSAYLDRVEDAGEPTHPVVAQAKLQSLRDKLDGGLAASRERLGARSLLERLRDFFAVPYRARHADLGVYASENVASAELSREQMFVNQRIVEAIESLQANLGESDQTMPVRRVLRGREAIATYVDELKAYSLSSEEQVRATIASNRRAAEAEVDAINLASFERLLQLREKKGVESQPRDGEGRFGPAFKTKWFGPTTDFTFRQKGLVMAGYGATAAAATAASAFLSPLVVPVTIGSAAFAGWFGVRYHLYHLAEKAAVHVRAEYNFRKWKHWDRPREARREAKAPCAGAWLANLTDLRDFAQRTDIPQGLAFHTYDVHLPLDMKFFGTEPRLDGQNIRHASARKNPGRLLSRLVRVTQALEFDETNEPVLTTTAMEIPNDVLRPRRSWADLAFTLLVLVTPK